MLTPSPIPLTSCHARHGRRYGPVLWLPAVGRKEVTAAFDGGRLTSDGGVMMLALVERRLGIAERLARLIPDRRDPTRITHSLADMIRARIFAICCGYEDCDDLDALRTDPASKLACGRLPDTGVDLCSQPTLSRLENAPRLRDVIRLTYALVDAWMDSYPREPDAVTLDIDDTCDDVHGHQQLSLFNAHYDERCFLPIHVYDTERNRPVAVVLRPGKTPSGVEVRAHVRRLVRRIRGRWPKTRILFRGDGHTPGPRPWRGARPTGCSTCSACRALSHCRKRSRTPPMPSAPSAPSATNSSCATTPKPGTGRAPGTGSAAPWHA